MNGSHHVRNNLEQKYGRKELMKMINDSMSEDWVQLNSKKCPHCYAAIEVSTLLYIYIFWRKLGGLFPVLSPNKK